MPDGIGLASLGSGIAETFFGGLLRDHQDEKERKDKELVRQLAAYQALMQHPDTVESDIPDITDAMAKLLKAEKETKPITDHMRQAMRRQVPYGAERETTQSRVDRMEARSVPTEPTALPQVSITPRGGGAVLESPAGMTTPALRSVPPEPVNYQPTREYGTLTRGEAAELREDRIYGARQEAQFRRQLGIQESAEIARMKRQDDQQAAREREIELKGEESRKTQGQLFDNKIKMLEPELQSKARLRVAQIAASLSPALPPVERERQAREIAFGEIQVGIEQKKVQITKAKAEMERMGVLNAKTWEEIRASKDNRSGLGAGMSAGVKREFDLRTRTLQDQLTSVFRQLEAAYKEAEGAPDPKQQANIERLEAEKADLWVSIDTVRNGLLNRSESGVPSAPVVRPKSDPLNLFGAP